MWLNELKFYFGLKDMNSVRNSRKKNKRKIKGVYLRA